MGNLRPMPKDLLVTLRTGAACWRLYSTALDQMHHLLDEFQGKSVCLGDLLRRFIAFDIGFEDRIENLVGRQRVGVLLIGTQLRRGRLLQDCAPESLPCPG